MINASLTRLAPRARLLFYMQAFSRLVLFWIPVTGAAIAGGAALWSPLYAVVVGLVWLFFLFLIAVWMPALSHANYGYAIRNEDLLIARGVLIKTIVAIPTSRIQHVDTRQGPLEQWMGLARLQIHTASGVGGDGVIPGLDLAIAESLRDLLVHVEGEAGV
jgi:membrane protein YdbS with pleckstrin-like domain